MLDWLLDINIVSGWFVDTVRVLVFAGLAWLAVALWRRSRRRLLVAVIVGVVCFGLGLLLTWLVSDVWVSFGVTLGWTVIRRTALGLGMLGAAVVGIVALVGWRRAVSCLLAVLVLVFTGTQIDGAYNQYPKVRSLFGMPYYAALSSSLERTATLDIDQWRETQSSSAPSTGRTYSVDIPATTSGFAARHANVWLPPAALTDEAAALPVIIVLSGQPGSTDDLFVAGGLDTVLDQYAAAHDGVAPIVVAPDQLGAPLNNPICVDSTQYGNVETYLTVDVPNWIRAHLPVASGVDQWALAGFSQGATCTMQIGPAYPQLFGSMFAISSEIEPNNGTEQQMIDQYFAGSRDAFVSHTPLGAIAQHAPSSQHVLFAAGSGDSQAQSNITQLRAAADAAGMTTRGVLSEGTSHDFWTVRNVLPAGIDQLGVWFGLTDQAQSLSTWSSVSEIEGP
ncbi:alpha/beta hydrolase [Pseudoclavibacter soli]|uniref:alpha/beta hydrolase n=1 Tax=Pseudoclavibacter soli TaxID=452623 RepID=UPI0004007ECC|nr:alpha/beta hydrolase-fold protein [Pseudoclavibacter soli]